MNAIVHLRRFLKRHAAAAPTKRAAFINFEVAPFPHSKVLRDGIFIVTNYLERIRVLTDKAINPRVH